jgi:hypothetical protein
MVHILYLSVFRHSDYLGLETYQFGRGTVGRYYASCYAINRADYFFFPVMLAPRQNSWIKLLILIQVLGLEFLMGWLFTNQQLALWMVVKILLSAGLFVLIFRKQLQQSNIKHPLIDVGLD